MNYRAWIIEDLQSLPADKRELEETDNQLVYDYKKKHIADIERLLFQLSEDERIIIEHIVINKGRAGELTEKTGLTVKQIYEVREDILVKLCQLRFGIGYQE